MRERLEALMRSIRERPADDELRLVYADALEEAGERRRAEFIRCELGGDTDRADQLRLEHNSELAGPLISEVAVHWTFERGLVAGLEIELTPFVEHGAELLRSAPIVRLSLHDDDDDAEPTAEMGAKLMAIEELSQLRSLGAIPVSYARDFLEAWLLSPHFTSLEALTFVYGEEADLASIVSRSPMPALRELCFWMESGNDGDEVASHIARSPLRSTLTRFEISGCEPTDDAVLSIVNSPYLHSLEQILFGSSHYSGTTLTDDAIGALATAKNLTRLRTLDLSGTELTDEALAPLAKAKGFQLQSLHLPENQLTNIRPILRAPACSSLRTLDLRANQLDDRAALAIAEWKGASNLRYVALNRNPISAEVRALLANAKSLADCEVVLD